MARDPDVGLRSREARGGEEREQRPLRRRAGRRRAVLEQAAKPRVGEPVPAHQAPDERLVECDGDAGVGGGGEVLERADHRGDRQAVAELDVAPSQRPDAVQPDALARAAVRGRVRDVEGWRRRREKSVERRCGGVGEDGVRADGEQRRLLGAERRERRVPERVDPAVHPVQGTRGQAPLDLLRREADGEELPAGDQPALRRGDGNVERRPGRHGRSTLPSPAGVNVDLAVRCRSRATLSPGYQGPAWTTRARSRRRAGGSARSRCRSVTAR